MNALAERTTLVIAGSWNPAVVTPQWIVREILGKGVEEPFQVGVQVAIANSPDGTPLPNRFTFDGLSFLANFDSLMFFLDYDSVQNSSATFKTAAKILNTLPHTPITAFGVNFSYSSEPRGPVIDLFDSFVASSPWGDDGSVTPVQQTWGVTLKSDDHLINLGCRNSSNFMEVTFNHHYEVGSAVRGAEALAQEGLFEKLKVTSLTMAKKLIGDNL